MLLNIMNVVGMYHNIPNSIKYRLLYVDSLPTTHIFYFDILNLHVDNPVGFTIFTD